MAEIFLNILKALKLQTKKLKHKKLEENYSKTHDKIV